MINVYVLIKGEPGLGVINRVGEEDQIRRFSVFVEELRLTIR